MSTNDPKAQIRIDLTQEYRRPVQGATDKDRRAIELTVEELEERIAPRLSSNHNETMLAHR